MSSKIGLSPKSLTANQPEKSEAATIFWDFLFLLEKLELYGTDKHLMPHSGPGTDNGAEYVQKFGKSDT